jgi:hypothetical protein
MKRIGDLISTIFDEKFIEKTKGYSTLFDCWEDLMLKNGIARAVGHSWIKNVEKGLVWIEVDHPGWKQILQTKESKLLHDFRYRFPDMGISGISIVLCKPGANKEQIEVINEKGKVKREEKKASSAAIPAIETSDTQYSEIKDEALRALLDRLEKRIAESNR